MEYDKCIFKILKNAVLKKKNIEIHSKYLNYYQAIKLIEFANKNKKNEIENGINILSKWRCTEEYIAKKIYRLKKYFKIKIKIRKYVENFDYLYEYYCDSDNKIMTKYYLFKLKSKEIYKKFNKNNTHKHIYYFKKNIRVDEFDAITKTKKYYFKYFLKYLNFILGCGIFVDETISGHDFTFDKNNKTMIQLILMKI